jgi:hypothetical protein
MLGLGPIMEGYSIIASRGHIPSYFDLPEDWIDDYVDFRETVLKQLAQSFQPAILTEHGRVPACDFYDQHPHQAHCYHAHQLVFPAEVDLEPRLRNAFKYDISKFTSFNEAHAAMKETEEEYLYYEGADRQPVVIPTPQRHIRQFFRLLVADAVGHPERTGWREEPGWPLIDSARERLGLTQ